MERQPEEPPEWVDTLANEVETQRLTAMEVLIKEELYPEAVQDSLTTKFAHDWCAKDFTMPNGDVVKRWLRRSRLVAREYAFMERRDDCFSPATSTHVMNLLPMIYLQRCAERRGCEQQSPEHVLATVDIKDAFLCVPQSKPFTEQLARRRYIIQRISQDNTLEPKRGIGFSGLFFQQLLAMNGVLSSHACVEIEFQC